MKLLLENWRGFIKEDDNVTVKVTPIHVRWARDAQKELAGAGLYVNKYLGQGQMGIVYEVEDRDSGKRLAAKFVKKTDDWADREVENYKWVRDNRDRLPEEVAQHLVKVYEVIEREHVYVFLIELLEKADVDVIKQLLATDDYDAPAGEDKEARIFRDEGALWDLIQNVVMSANTTLAGANVEKNEVESAVREIHRLILSGAKAERQPRVYYGELNYYMGASKARQNIINTILSELLSLVDASLASHISHSLARLIDGKMNYFLQKQVVPIHDYAPRHGVTGGAEGYTKDAFPEAESLMRAMQYLTKKEQWSPGDVHSKNVMARPGSKELVIMDLGLFKKLE